MSPGPYKFAFDIDIFQNITDTSSPNFDRNVSHFQRDNVLLCYVDLIIL